MKYVLLILCLALSLQGSATGKDTFEVYFPLNVSKVSQEAKDYMDKLVFKDSLVHGDKLIVQGYADFIGGTGYNDTLSLIRANNVRDYLISTGLDPLDIKACVGKGKIDRNMKSKNGYAPDRKVQIIIDRAPRTAKELKEQVDYDALEVDQTFALNNILFKLNSAELMDKSQPDLEKLLAFLKKYPTVKVRIEGHVCCMGPVEGEDSRNKKGFLSVQRAETVYKYLVDKGIDKDRLTHIGLGNRNPVVKVEITEADKVKNRRVEIRIMSK